MKNNKQQNQDMVDRKYLTKENKENPDAVKEAVTRYLIEKEQRNFFSDCTELFVNILYEYKDLINEKYPNDTPYGFYHIVALSDFQWKELLFLIFEKYDKLKGGIFPFRAFIENEQSELLKHILKIPSSIFPELINIKKYNLLHATKDIHNLIANEIDDLYIKKGNIEDKKRIKPYVFEIVRSRSMGEITKNKYKVMKRHLEDEIKE